MRNFLVFLFFFFAVFLLPSSVYAAGGSIWDNCFYNSMEVYGAENVATLRCLPSIVQNVANAFLLFAGVVALFILVWSGIRFVISGGDAKQIGNAKSMMTYAIIGLVVVLSSYAIIFFLGYVTGTSNCITDLNRIINVDTGCK